jgi:hypothetical protein
MATATFTFEALPGMDRSNPRLVDLGVMDNEGTVVERFSTASYGKALQYIYRMARTFAFDVAEARETVWKAFTPSEKSSVLSDRDVRGIKWVYRCSAVRLNSSTVEGYKATVLLGVCGCWESLGELDDVLATVASTVAAHGGYCQ